MTSKKGHNFRLAGTLCPIRRCRLPKDVFQIRSGATFDEQPYNFFVAPSGCLMQWRGMRVASHRVITVWVFPRVEQKTNNLHMTKIRSQAQR